MSASTLSAVLCKVNEYERDNNIKFHEEGHKYTILTDITSKYTSVTTWNHSHFPKFNSDEVIKKMMKGKNWNTENKYWGMNADEIKNQWKEQSDLVSSEGTKLHYNIECFMNNKEIEYPYTHKELLEYYLNNKKEDTEESLEWQYFLKYVEDNKNYKPYRTEWMIYDEDLKLSGSIDMVYEKEDGTLMIYDWKRSKNISRINNFNKYATTYCISHLPDSNFWHYALQLNTYKAIIESKYNKKVSELSLVIFHPDTDEYEMINIPDLNNEIQELFKLRKKDITDM